MRGALLVAALVTIVSCGTAPAATVTRYQAEGTVLSDDEHGPQLCDLVMESLPPQCGGIDLAGWDWEAVEHSAQGGVRWGEYHVVGTWDGAKLTLTEPPRPAGQRDAPGGGPDFTSPCPRPEGGWRPADPAKATQEAMEAALARAQELPGYAGSWLDQSYLEEMEGDPGSVERHGNDPKRLVLNVRFTGDPAAHEAAIRELWGGALCLSPAEHTEAELQAVRERVEKEVEGLRSASVDILAGRVEVGVWVVTPELEREVAERYGEGLVHLSGMLRPV
ncbi:hypothetical protein [Nonomuraea harbinensis]|uniref:Uncharacterized protein n=1 Tax=Nonomuraea harbinensis TaxID=1286938 RepID=A0ABW1CAW8_9ACTN|nr:hypothetical protein [Nonomuraea harbinensis]